MKTMPETILIDFTDFDALRNLMDTHGETLDSMISAVNEEGEDQTISINPDNIVLDTCQNNGWVRRNIYWYDGDVEELFDGRWK